jgi:hypothetical protein
MTYPGEYSTGSSSSTCATTPASASAAAESADHSTWSTGSAEALDNTRDVPEWKPQPVYPFQDGANAGQEDVPGKITRIALYASVGIYAVWQLYQVH